MHARNTSSRIRNSSWLPDYACLIGTSASNRTMASPLHLRPEILFGTDTNHSKASAVGALAVLSISSVVSQHMVNDM